MRITVFGASGAVGSRVTQEALSRGHDVTAVGRNLARLRDLNRLTAALPGVLRIRRGDASDPQSVAELTTGQDVVISATRPVPGHENELPTATKGLLAGLTQSHPPTDTGTAIGIGTRTDSANGTGTRIGADTGIGTRTGTDTASRTGARTGTDTATGIHTRTGIGTPTGVRTGAHIRTRLIVVGGAASLLLPSGTTVLDGPGFPPDWRPIAEACNEQFAVLRAESDIDWTYVSPPAVLEPGIRTGNYRLGKDHLLIDADGNSAISMEDFAIALIDEAEQPRHHRTRFTVGHHPSPE